MPDESPLFDITTARADWDANADAYADAQATGLDVYRLALFGPAQVALCAPPESGPSEVPFDCAPLGQASGIPRKI
jgi:hypothetical protein